MSVVKLSNIQEAMHNSIRATFDLYKLDTYKDLPHFQDRFEHHHNCKVIKSYSQQPFILSPIADITYWNSLKFADSQDITMFVLKWS